MDDKTITISGSIFLSNGQGSGIMIFTHGTWKSDKGENLPYELRIQDKQFFLELQEGYENETITDKVVVQAKHIIDGIILGFSALQGIGLQYVVESCKLANGKLEKIQPDQLKSTFEINLTQEEVVYLVSENQQLRFAARDFNSGLLDRENCPLLFYRAIESLAKTLVGPEKEINKNEWDEFHTLLGTKADDMGTIHRINSDHRHGKRTAFDAIEYKEMLSATKFFMLKTMEYLQKSKSAGTSPITS